MVIIGLTGGIATGKSTLTRLFRRRRIPVFDADRCVHNLYKSDFGLIKKIGLLCPESLQDNTINRPLLRNAFFTKPHLKVQIETLVHERVWEKAIAFIKRANRMRIPLLVLDIPLLLESGMDMLCSDIFITYCPPRIQRQRLKKRGLSQTLITQFLAQPRLKPPPTAYIIPTGLSKYYGYTVWMRCLDKAR
jgi:dephospho-CoA kinase